MTLRSFFLSLGCVALTACGSTIIEKTPGDSGSGGASASAAATTTGEGGASATTTGSGGGPPICGGWSGASCPPETYCDWSDDSCGGYDGQGTCQPLPDACDDDCPGVCGCDGEFYCNVCTAHANGTDVLDAVSCSPSDSSISAYYWPGGLDHLVVRKKDEDANWCVLIHTAWPTSSQPGFDITLPTEWGVSYAMITDSAADCDDPLSQGGGSFVEAEGAVGMVDWTVPPGLFAPCLLSLVDVTLTFPENTPWAPASVNLSSIDVPVENGCM